jgi:hypothetical protein
MTKLEDIANTTILPDSTMTSVFAQVLVSVDVDGLDNYWRNDQRYIQPHTWNSKKFKRAKHSIALAVKGLRALDAGVFVVHDRAVQILDGKRRFAYLRDKGVEKIGMATTWASAARAQELGFVNFYILDLN